MKRLHRRVFRLNERIESLNRELAQVRAELGYHRNINEDAQRDAAVGNYIDREEADLTAADVRRFENAVVGLERKRVRLMRKREVLLQRIGD